MPVGPARLPRRRRVPESSGCFSVVDSPSGAAPFRRVAHHVLNHGSRVWVSKASHKASHQTSLGGKSVDRTRDIHAISRVWVSNASNVTMRQTGQVPGPGRANPVAIRFRTLAGLRCATRSFTRSVTRSAGATRHCQPPRTRRVQSLSPAAAIRTLTAPDGIRALDARIERRLMELRNLPRAAARDHHERGSRVVG